MKIRDLQTKDMFKLLKILNKTEMMKELSNMGNKKNQTQIDKENMAKEMMLGVISNLDKAETEIYEFIGSLTGQSAKKISEQSPMETINTIKEIANSDVFKSFFTELSN